MVSGSISNIVSAKRKRAAKRGVARHQRRGINGAGGGGGSHQAAA